LSLSYLPPDVFLSPGQGCENLILLFMTMLPDRQLRRPNRSQMLHYHFFGPVFFALCQLICVNSFNEMTYNELVKFDYRTIMLKRIPDPDINITN
jgi:hypothetical protein